MDVSPHGLRRLVRVQAPIASAVEVRHSAHFEQWWPCGAAATLVYTTAVAGRKQRNGPDTRHRNLKRGENVGSA
jgi:hypothetical protein